MRPVTLPHHRTCRFRHPAVGTGRRSDCGKLRWHLPRCHSVDSRSPRVAFDRPQGLRHAGRPHGHFHQLLVHCFLSSLAAVRLARDALGRLPGFTPTDLPRPSDSCRSCRSLGSRATPRSASNASGLASLLVPSALRSSRLSPGLHPTTASADSSGALTPEASPGKVPELSPRAVRLCLVRLDGFWTSHMLARSSPAPGLAAGSCPYGRGFAFRFFQLVASRPRPCGSATVAPIGSDALLSCHKFRPMPGTLARISHKRKKDSEARSTSC